MPNQQLAPVKTVARAFHGGTDRQLTARGLLLAELDLIRTGQLQSRQEHL